MDKNKMNYLIIVLVFCVIIVGAGGFYLGTHFNSEDNKERENGSKMEEKKDNNKVIDNQKKEQEELEALSKSLIDMTSVGDYLYSYFYNGDYLDYDGMQNYGVENNIRLDAAIRSIPKELRTYTKYKTVEEFYDSCPIKICTEDDCNYSCPYYSVKKNDLEKYYHKIFGNDKDIIYEEFINTDFEESAISALGITVCKLEGDIINCYPFDGGDDGWYINFIKYDNANMIDDNTLVVYVKYLAIDPVGLYSNRNDDSLLVEGNFTEEDEDYLWKNYEDKSGRYKLTFRKENNNWYWEFTKLIKE